jgi:hypothetical protein
VKLQYLHPTRGWWTAHAAFTPPDPLAYITGLRLVARIIDGTTVYETSDTACTICQQHHDGRNGDCLI